MPFLEAFAEPYPETILFLTDPDRAAYRALNLRRGMGGLKSMGMLTSGIRAYRAGHRQSRTQGDPLQQGGIFVVAPGGRAVFIHRSETAGDHAETHAIVDAIPL